MIWTVLVPMALLSLVMGTILIGLYRDDSIRCQRSREEWEERN